MTDQADRIESVFAAALQQPSSQERGNFLDRECADNPVLRGRVEALLKAHDRAGSFLKDPPARTQETEDYVPITELPGTVIGPYRLMEAIGEGGFGLVFVAEQQQPVRRRVALKIIKPGMDTRDIMARFEAERQALALMDHPNIARVFDAGTTESGRPYFVMELVKGIPIVEYCDQQQLTRSRAPGTVRIGLPGRAARARQGCHPPGPQAVERPGGPARRHAGGQGDRLRRRQGDRPAADGQDDLHPLHADDRDAALHEPGTGGDQRPGRGHPQ
jgi:hypothetical protein